MSSINKPIEFTTDLLQLIKTKLADINFSHVDWDNDDLLPLRSFIRNYYRIQQSGKCVYCQNEVSLYSPANAHVEHIVPKSIHLGFIFNEKNLCVICADCNTIKRNQETLQEIPDTLNGAKGRKLYPRSSKAFKIVHPHFDVYEEHIKKCGRIYIDRTEKGGFTISACKLNRFFHKFDSNESFVSDENLIALMQRFIDSNSHSERASIIGEIVSSSI